VTEFRNTLDFGATVANGTTPSAALTDNGGDRVLTLTNTSIMKVDTTRPLTPDARSCLLIETAAGVTTAGAVVLGNIDGNGRFRIRFTWELLNSTTCIIMRFYDTASTSATMFGVQRVGGGAIQWLDKTNAIVASTPATVLLNDAAAVFEAYGTIRPGTTTTDGHFDVTIVNAETGAVLYSHSRDNINTGTVPCKNMHFGKISATGATGTGIRARVQNIALADGASTEPPAPFRIWTPKPGKVKVAAATGASNSAGRAVLADTSTRPYDDRVWVIHQRGPNAGRPMPATELLRHSDPASLYGPTWAFVQDYIADGRLAADGVLLLVPKAWGGTGFTVPDSNGAQMTWRPDAPDDANGLYHRANEVIDQALTLGGAGSQLVAIVHNAGSTDGINNTPKETYRGFFLALVDAWRAKYGTIPIVFMQSRRDLLAAEPRHRWIDEVVQETTGKMPGGPVRARTAHADSTSNTAEYAVDNVHFLAAGYDTNGHNNYAALAVAESNTGSASTTGELALTVDVAAGASTLVATSGGVALGIDVAAAAASVARTAAAQALTLAVSAAAVTVARSTGALTLATTTAAAPTAVARTAGAVTLATSTEATSTTIARAAAAIAVGTEISATAQEVGQSSTMAPTSLALTLSATARPIARTGAAMSLTLSPAASATAAAGVIGGVALAIAITARGAVVAVTSGSLSLVLELRDGSRSDFVDITVTARGPFKRELTARGPRR
jgi:hypothetical protein